MQAERREQKLALSLEQARAEASQPPLGSSSSSPSLGSSPPARCHLTVAAREQPGGLSPSSLRDLGAQADEAALTVRRGTAQMQEDVRDLELHMAQAEASC